MLNFYLVPDSQNISSKGLMLERIGGIEYEAFIELQTVGIIEPWFDYYSKFRWVNELVAQMSRQLKDKLTLCNDSGIFVAILQKAVDCQSGLLAFGD